MIIDKRVKRVRRKKSIRNKIRGTIERPRLSVFKSCKNIYAQLIDDDNHNTLCMASTLDKSLDLKSSLFRCNKEIASSVGKVLAKRAKDKKITKVVFDRNGYPFHGRVKALADACREGGLIF
jgi:large subunit ribosomal protein L18